MPSEEFLYEGQCLENLVVKRTAKVTELSKAIHHLNKGKAAGIDQFSGEMLKGGGKVKTWRLHYLGKEWNQDQMTEAERQILNVLRMAHTL